METPFRKLREVVEYGNPIKIWREDRDQAYILAVGYAGINTLTGLAVYGAATSHPVLPVPAVLGLVADAFLYYTTYDVNNPC